MQYSSDDVVCKRVSNPVMSNHPRNAHSSIVADIRCAAHHHRVIVLHRDAGVGWDGKLPDLDVLAQVQVLDVQLDEGRDGAPLGLVTNRAAANKTTQARNTCHG